MGLSLWMGNSRTLKVTQENIALCFPHLTAEQRQALIKQRLTHLGMMVMELPFVWHRPVPQVLATIRHVKGEELITDPLANNQGVLLLAPHIGNWEVVGLYLGQKYPMTSMYQPQANEALDKMVMQARERSGAALVPTNTSGIKAQLKALKKGELVGILPDQTPPKASGEFAPFFNIPALTATLSFNLCQRTGAKVVVAYAQRLPSGGFDLVIEPAPEGIYSADQLTALTALNGAVEQCIAAIPEQYQWEYKRFRRQPEGGKQYYRKK